MKDIYEKLMAQMGYKKLVCDIFLNWENVKDELLIPERKQGSGNGTVHVFLGAADEKLREEFADYYASVEKGGDTETGAINIKHYFLPSNMISLLGYNCKFLFDKDTDFTQKIKELLVTLQDAKLEGNLLYTSSLFKLSTGSNKVRPYFKQFDQNGIFCKLVRLLLLPNSAYKISLYKNEEEEYAAFWLIGFDSLTDFEIDSEKKHFLKFEESTHSFTKLGVETLQRIIYGAPGTGKSHLIKAQTKDKSVIRTTFHPDSDYSTFVGAYKPSTAEQVKYGLQGQPILGNDGKPLKEQIITYKFVQQAFVKAYIAAWRNYPKPEFLVIEEINRGNCAQIFGDLFQLLDRNDEGFSEYSIAADEDLRKELKEQLENSDNEIKASYQKVFNGEELLLPNNLYIWATMNTSDQSLFPIDSAFKRRWEWKYVPICNANKGYYISVNGKKYDWWNFLEEINKKIEETTSSEDKKMGYFFCKAKDDGCICADTFVGKVLFYIWNDVFKVHMVEDSIFKDAEGKELKFQQFFNADGSANEDMVERFLKILGISAELKENTDFGPIGDDEEDALNNGSRDTTRFSINGQGSYNKRKLVETLFKQYQDKYPDKNSDEIYNDWLSLEIKRPSNFIETDDMYLERTSSSKDSQQRATPFTCKDGEKLWISNQWSIETVKELIDKIKAKNWGFDVEEIDG